VNLHVSASAEIAPHTTVIRSLPAFHPPQREVFTPATLWSELINGRLRIIQHGVDDTEAWLTLKVGYLGAHQRVTPVQAHVAELVLAGKAQKTFLFDPQRSPSTISLNCSQALRGFGVACSARRAPLALAMIAVAHRLQPVVALPGYRVEPGNEPDSFQVRMSRPEFALRPLVTRAEYEALRGIVAGLTYKQVSVVRDCSHRTVANQLRSVACKLRVCSRLQVVRLAVQRLNGLGATVEA
jgi:DNA-binding CsgD family transcriptional regulator